MRHAGTAVALLLILSCRSGEVRKEEAVVTLKERPSKPYESRKKVAILEFQDKSGYGPGRLGKSAADILTTFLVKSQQFRIFDRQQIAKILDEQKFQQSGAVDGATAVKIGKIIGVDLVVYGAVSNFGIRTEGTEAVFYQQKEQVAECQVDVRLIGVETAEVIFADEGRGSARREVRGSLGVGGRMSYDETLAGDSLRAAIVKFVDNLVDQAP